MTCGGCPSQWDAESTEGEYVYIRFRHGGLTVECGDVLMFAASLDDRDGILSEDELVSILFDNNLWSGPYQMGRPRLSYTVTYPKK